MSATVEEIEALIDQYGQHHVRLLGDGKVEVPTLGSENAALRERVAEMEAREHKWKALDDALTNGDDSTVYDLRMDLYPQPEGDPFPPLEPTDAE